MIVTGSALAVPVDQLAVRVVVSNASCVLLDGLTALVSSRSGQVSADALVLRASAMRCVRISWIAVQLNEGLPMRKSRRLASRRAVEGGRGHR